MNYDELNDFIKHYIEKDKTQSAIMLTGDWGTGKSYYIHNSLEPFLKEPKNGKHRCAIVSLYGLENTSEISKRIYFELRSIGCFKKSEAISTGKAVAKVLAKTVLNGMTNMIGFDIGSINDKDLKRIYASIDLTNALVVFEDLERSSIDIIEILGYVNSLVEQDGAKVLFVANENEILKYCDSIPDVNGEIHKVPDEKTEAYLRAKEKTISDTIIFKDNNTLYAIENILSSFNNKVLKNFISYKNILNIYRIMMTLGNYNLRTFRYACQKSADIFEKLNNLEDYIIKSIFFGIIAFSIKIKNGVIPDWKGEDSISTELGIGNYPLFHFCYEYIKWQNLTPDLITNNLSEYRKMRIFDKNVDDYDEDLYLINSFEHHDKGKVMRATYNLVGRLNILGDISFYQYERLAYILIKCNTIWGLDYSLYKESMTSNIYRVYGLCGICRAYEVCNLYGIHRITEIDTTPFFWSEQKFTFNDEGERKKFNAFSKEISEAVSSASHLLNDTRFFLYIPEALDTFYEYVKENKNKVIFGRVFISQFSMNKLTSMISKCTTSQLIAFRKILIEIYNDAKTNDFLVDDFTYISKLYEYIDNNFQTCVQSKLLSKIDQENKFGQLIYLKKDLELYLQQLV